MNLTANNTYSKISTSVTKAFFYVQHQKANKCYDAFKSFYQQGEKSPQLAQFAFRKAINKQNDNIDRTIPSKLLREDIKLSMLDFYNYINCNLNDSREKMQNSYKNMYPKTYIKRQAIFPYIQDDSLISAKENKYNKLKNYIILKIKNYKHNLIKE